MGDERSSYSKVYNIEPLSKIEQFRKILRNGQILANIFETAS